MNSENQGSDPRNNRNAQRVAPPPPPPPRRGPPVPQFRQPVQVPQMQAPQRGPIHMYQHALMQQQQRMNQRGMITNQRGFHPVNLPAPPPPIPRMNPPPQQQRGNSTVIFSADQSFELLTQLMAYGYIERREELPNMVVMVLQHFENLRRLKQQRQNVHFRQTMRHRLSEVSEPNFQQPPPQMQGQRRNNEGGI